MLSRAFIGVLIGLVSGACIGAAGFAASQSLFGRGIGLLGPAPRLAAIVGAVSVGTLGAVVGAIVGSVNLWMARAGLVGAAAGLLMAALSLWRGGHQYSFGGGYFDWQSFFGDMLDCATWVFGLAFAAIVVSAAVHKLFASSR